MNINLTTKFDIGQKVFYVSHTTSHLEIPCTHCHGNYREIVNDIEYTCPYCKGGREKMRIDDYEVQSGIVTNIRIAVNGIYKYEDHETGQEIFTNYKYSVTENHTEFVFDADGSSTNRFESELFATEEEAAASIKVRKEVRHKK